MLQGEGRNIPALPLWACPRGSPSSGLEKRATGAAQCSGRQRRLGVPGAPGLSLGTQAAVATARVRRAQVPAPQRLRPTGPEAEGPGLGNLLRAPSTPGKPPACSCPGLVSVVHQSCSTLRGSDSAPSSLADRPGAQGPAARPGVQPPFCFRVGSCTDLSL